jgi:hypothetical protein
MIDQLFQWSATQMVKMIKTIGAITVMSPRNFIGATQQLPPRRGRSPADSR